VFLKSQRDTRSRIPLGGTDFTVSKYKPVCIYFLTKLEFTKVSEVWTALLVYTNSVERYSLSQTFRESTLLECTLRS
jgi:hypothetical protein